MQRWLQRPVSRPDTRKIAAPSFLLEIADPYAMLFAYVGYRHEANAFYPDGVEVCHDDDRYD
ncbi:MAG: hypothetical protein WCE52_21430 [Candidatus Acidiferrum sp.]